MQVQIIRRHSIYSGVFLTKLTSVITLLLYVSKWVAGARHLVMPIATILMLGFPQVFWKPFWSRYVAIRCPWLRKFFLSVHRLFILWIRQIPQQLLQSQAWLGLQKEALKRYTGEWQIKRKNKRLSFDPPHQSRKASVYLVKDSPSLWIFSSKRYFLTWCIHTHQTIQCSEYIYIVCLGW